MFLGEAPPFVSTSGGPRSCADGADPVVGIDLSPNQIEKAPAIERSEYRARHVMEVALGVAGTPILCWLANSETAVHADLDGYSASPYESREPGRAS